MKFLFLHLSDLHLKSYSSINRLMIQKLVDAVCSVGRFDSFIVVTSGDVAFSGERSQYDAAYLCIGSIVAGIKRRQGFSDHAITVCVPGNHDIQFENPPRGTKFLQDMRKLNSYEKHIQGELDKQREFFSYSARIHGHPNPFVFCREIVDINGFSMEINLINSAPFSLMEEEDKGLHYFPNTSFSELCAPSGADFAITVMHHSPEWFIDEQKNSMEPAIFKRSSIVFYGHEHFGASKTVLFEESRDTFVQAGGCLCNDTDWSMSAFNVGLFDTTSREYSVTEFGWNGTAQQYECQKNCNRVLPYKPFTKAIPQVKHQYLEEMVVDTKRDLATDFREYYVFPRITSIESDGLGSKEFTTEESFYSEVLERKRVLILGAYNSGKSALLKSLFLRITADRYAIYVGIDDIRGKRADRIIKGCFEDIYGDDYSDYQRFLQAPKEQKVLIIDDIDQIAPKDFEWFISQIRDNYLCFVFAARTAIDLDLIERMKQILEAKDAIQKYKLSPFFADKRAELIRRVVVLKLQDPDAVDRVTQQLSSSLKAQKRFFLLDPDFILKYAEYYCSHIGDVSGNDSSVFSRVFEASITNAIGKHQSARLPVDKVFTLLSRIAHSIHFQKKYPISHEEVVQIISAYNDYFGSYVVPEEAISIMLKAHILVEGLDGCIRFLNKSYLAFFVAQEVNRRYNETAEDDDLQYLLTYACFGINSDILLFISYITDNVRILRYIFQKVKEYTAGWKEFTFDDTMPSFLKNPREHVLSLPAVDARERETELEVQHERTDDTSLQTSDIYDYSEAEIDDVTNQLLRSFSLLSLISRCLPAFEHVLPKPDKDELVSEIYTLPNIIFYKWAALADAETSDLIQYFRERSQDYYHRQKELTDDEIIRALQWAAMSLLLELYNIAVSNSARAHTMQYLDKFSEVDEPTYSLQHLMIVERQNSGDAFCKEALRLNEKKPPFNYLYNTIVARIVDHALVHMDAIDYKQRQQLGDTFFIPANRQRELLVERQKVTRQRNE